MQKDTPGVNFVVFIGTRLSGEGHQYIEYISTFSEAVHQRSFNRNKTGALRLEGVVCRPDVLCNVFRRS
jgi:hypothetical protein